MCVPNRGGEGTVAIALDLEDKEEFVLLLVYWCQFGVEVDNDQKVVL